MRKLTKTFALITTCTLAAASGSIGAKGNQSDINFGYKFNSIEEADVDSIIFRYHYDWTPFLGFDGELGFGVSDDNISGVKAEADFNYGAYITGNIPMGNIGSDIFLKLGYASVDVEASAAGISASDEQDGFSWGVGTNIMFTKRHGMRLDYTDIDADLDTDSWSISYVYSF